MNTYLQPIPSFNMSFPDWMEDDIWPVEKVGLAPNTTSSSYYLNFSRLAQSWFKHAVKRFVRFQAATRSLSSCRSYVVNLCHFSLFLEACQPHILPHEVNRQLIVDFIAFMAQTKLSPKTRGIALTHLKTFHALVVQEKWLPWPLEPLVYTRDFPPLIKAVPRFIPETVVAQLQRNLHKLLPYMQHVVTILLETGRRISEVCILPFHCLESDHQGDYFLKIEDQKLKKTYLLPISKACLQAIHEQQRQLRESHVLKSLYLFPARQTKKSPHLSARYVNQALNELAEDVPILNDAGQIWHFHTHQFRHTVGTRMINAGVPQLIVQRYLGHESPEMTARYAHVHDSTMKKAFQEFQQQLVGINGKPYVVSDTMEDAAWLKHNIAAQTLPNGFCALPVVSQKCPHANACLSCGNFKTDKRFLPQHQQQLAETEKLIEQAKANGWERVCEVNKTVQANLKTIISALEKTDGKSHCSRKEECRVE